MLVGSGGFLGSGMRFLVSYLTERYWGHTFPWGTFIVNIGGCFLIGVLYGLWAREHLSDAGNRLWITGFCGGFTTFSTFSSDSIRLFHQAHIPALFLYVGGSVLIGFLATYLGLILVKGHV